jgi:hypothetical protein
MSHVWRLSRRSFPLLQGKQSADQNVGSIDRSLSPLDDVRRRQPLARRCRDLAIDLAYRDPRTVMTAGAPPAIRWSREAIGEIAARHHERADEVGARELRGELGQRWCRRDHGAERCMVLEWMNRTFGIVHARD